MIDVFNEIGVDVATPGNHDFDFGVDALIGAINRSKFPWILVSLISAVLHVVSLGRLRTCTFFCLANRQPCLNATV